MTFLNVKNRAYSTLDSGINDTVTELTVFTNEGAKFPATNFHITIDDEILLCSSRTNDVFTVVREKEGTTAAAHSSGVMVELRITAKIITQLRGLFGGDGSDGALSISSGTTTLDLGGVAVFIMNYTSISITGTGKLTFENPHVNGTLIILRSQGAVILTSSATPCIDTSILGGKGSLGNYTDGAKGLTTSFYTLPGEGVSPKSGGGGASMINPGTAGGDTGGAGGTVPIDISILPRARVAVFGSGAGGGSCNNVRSVGGSGGGGLLIECRGDLNFTGTIWGKGQDGVEVAGNGEGGGGGGGAVIGIIYETETAINGTITTTGGTGYQGSTYKGGDGGDGDSWLSSRLDIGI